MYIRNSKWPLVEDKLFLESEGTVLFLGFFQEQMRFNEKNHASTFLWRYLCMYLICICFIFKFGLAVSPVWLQSGKNWCNDRFLQNIFLLKTNKPIKINFGRHVPLKVCKKCHVRFRNGYQHRSKVTLKRHE